MFETHKLNETEFAEVKKFKSSLSMVLTEALILLPEGRDKSIFITKIEEAVFFGTRPIESKPGNFDEITVY